jgi:hypothetical protein
MRATLAPPKAPLVQAKEAKLGCRGGLPRRRSSRRAADRVRHRVEPRAVSFADYPDFQFSAETWKEGTQVGAASDEFDEYDPEDESAPEGTSAAKGSVPRARTVTLDAAGTAAIAIDKLPGERAAREPRGRDGIQRSERRAARHVPRVSPCILPASTSASGPTGGRDPGGASRSR